MKKVISILVIVLLYSCASTKNTSRNVLYEVLTVNNDGGANIKFYEILTEAKEINMLLSDEGLRQKIKADDMANSSFLILNTGPTKESYNRMKIVKVVETLNEIEIYLKDTQMNLDVTEVDDTTKFPYTIVKVNSKKPIIIK